MLPLRNFKMVCAITLSILASACGKENKALQLSGFESYVESFQSDAASQGVNITIDNLIIEFGTLDTESERGVCILKSDETPRIVIRQDTWELMSETSKTSLIYHELGHCVLRRVHDSSRLDGSSAANSLMNPYVVRGDIFTSNQNHYLQELFSRSNEI